MALRPYWKGQIRLALVSIPVEIYSATKSSATIAFNQIHEPSGKRIKYEKVVPGIGPVDVDEIVKGYEYAKGEYVILDEDEIEGVKLESKKTLELTQFVEAHDIDAIYFEKPYYVVPGDELAEEAARPSIDEQPERRAEQRDHKPRHGEQPIRIVPDLVEHLSAEFQAEIRRLMPLRLITRGIRHVGDPQRQRGPALRQVSVGRLHAEVAELPIGVARRKVQHLVERHALPCRRPIAERHMQAEQ